jgi:hypothetical protein
LIARTLAILIAVTVAGSLSAVVFIALSRQPSTRRLVGGQPLAYWVQCLDSGQDDLREAGRRNLPVFGGEAVDPLIARLDADDENVRRAAAWSLGKIGAPAIGHLARVLRPRGAGGARASTPACRCAVIELLGTMGVPLSAPASDDVALQLDDRDVCREAARYLVLCGVSPNGIATAARVLGGTEQTCRLQAVRVLLSAASSNAQARAALSASYSTGDPVVREAVRQALRDLDARPLQRPSSLVLAGPAMTQWPDSPSGATTSVTSAFPRDGENRSEEKPFVRFLPRPTTTTAAVWTLPEALDDADPDP